MSKQMPACYKIRVQNHLSSQWAEWFEGVTITNYPNGEATLSGSFRDQAALFGVLDKVRDLNLALNSLKRIEPGGTSTEVNKSIVRGYMEDVLTQGNLAAAGKYFAEHVVFNGGRPSKEIIAVLFRQFRTAFPDLQVDIEDQFSEGDKVATRVTFQGTHLGYFGDIPPTGRLVKFTGIAVDRIVESRVVEMWHEADFLKLKTQLQSI
jgi:predicted ester cyclase